MRLPCLLGGASVIVSHTFLLAKAYLLCITFNFIPNLAALRAFSVTIQWTIDRNRAIPSVSFE